MTEANNLVVSSHDSRPHKFVIVTSQRTGSTLLVRSLDSSAHILCAGELFHSGTNVLHDEFQYRRPYSGIHIVKRLIDIHFSTRRIHKHLKSFYSSAGKKFDAVGFKLMVSQVRSFPAIMPALKELGVGFIYLSRQDLFATALSYYRARTTKVFHSDRRNASRRPLTADINEDEFRKILTICKADKNQLLQLQRDYQGPLLTYEEMTSAWEAFVVRVGLEIGVPCLSVRMALSKLHSGAESMELANESDLRKKYANP